VLDYLEHRYNIATFRDNFHVSKQGHGIAMSLLADNFIVYIRD